MKNKEQVKRAIQGYYEDTKIKMTYDHSVASSLNRSYSYAENAYQTMISSLLVDTIKNHSIENTTYNINSVLNYFINIHDKKITNDMFSFCLANNMRIGILLSKGVYQGACETLSEEEVNEFKNIYSMYSLLIGKERTGWIMWNVNNEHYHRESIAEHIVGTMILARRFQKEFNIDIDLNKVLVMLLVHETEETVIGDITEFQGISPEEKMRMGQEAVESILCSFPNGNKIVSLTKEFDSKKTKEAKFAYLCDKFECDLQAERYERMGLNHLDHQENNKSYSDERVQKIIQDGAKDVAMIFHVFDQSKIGDNEPFKSGLEYIMKR